ncbi:MAG: hypothetical protein QM730_18820 [Anaerolineales bacterium]
MKEEQTATLETAAFSFQSAYDKILYACLLNNFCKQLFGMGGEFVPDLNNTKLKHIFGKSGHDLDALLQTFNGNQSAAFTAIYRAFAQVAGNYSPDELHDGITIMVNGIIVTVTGQIVNGVPRIGTVYIP